MKLHVAVMALLVTFAVSGAVPAQADVTTPVSVPTVQVSGAFGSLG
jgi:hypothetical protein